MTAEPYTQDHLRSVVGRTRRPKTLGQYIAWLVRHWEEELPGAIHTSGPYVGPPDRGTPTLAARYSTPAQLVGGSILGSPNLADPFRRLLENSPFELEHAELDGHQAKDPHYVRPLHASIARISHRRPLVARWIVALAASGGDWRGLAARRRWSDEEAELFLTAALELLWRDFEIAPTQR